MVILGVDPGTLYTGYGIVNYDKNQCSMIEHGLIRLTSYSSLSLKLEQIYNELNRIINIYHPDEFAIETAFYGKNVQSAMKIGYARGVSILAAVHNKVPLNEYSPREIKKAVVGNGAASKEQVFYMISNHLNLEKVKMRFDESDALAVAICHAFRLSVSQKRSRNWKEFTESFPERVIK